MKPNFTYFSMKNKLFRAAIILTLVFSSATLQVYSQWSGTNPLWTNSNVGIGSNSPSSSFVVKQSLTNINSTIDIIPNGTGWVSQLRFMDGSGGLRYAMIDDQTTGYLRFQLSGNNTMWVGGTIKAKGNGSVNSTIDLVGNGTGWTSQLRFFDASQNLKHTIVDDETTGNMKINAGGSGVLEVAANIAIGTSTPIGRLQVGSGTTRVSLGDVGEATGYYLTGYMGFNLARNSSNNWIASTDGGNNGGCGIVANVAGDMRFVTVSSTGSADQTLSDASVFPSKIGMTLKANGNIGIGTDSPSYKLDVCGTIRAKEVIVQTGWCDYVFSKEYKLMPLNELETYLKKNKHLPNIPPADQVETEGLKVAETQKDMMEKIEELTLYMIEMNKKLDDLQKKNALLEKKLALAKK